MSCNRSRLGGVTESDNGNVAIFYLHDFSSRFLASLWPRLTYNNSFDLHNLKSRRVVEAAVHDVGVPSAALRTGLGAIHRNRGFQTRPYIGGKSQIANRPRRN